jgi:hypothetical protein
MLLTISPNPENIDEALSTLGYASLARRVTNKPKPMMINTPRTAKKIEEAKIAEKEREENGEGEVVVTPRGTVIPRPFGYTSHTAALPAVPVLPWKGVVPVRGRKGKGRCRVTSCQPDRGSGVVEGLQQHKPPIRDRPASAHVSSSRGSRLFLSHLMPIHLILF